MTAQGNSPEEGRPARPGSPGPRPRPSAPPTPRPTPPAPAPTPEPAAPTGPPTSDWGRVEDDGTVYLRTAEGERVVGQYPEGTPGEALAFFTRRFDALEFEVQLLEQRVRTEALAPDEASESINRVAAQVAEANAVGDIVGLSARLDALKPLVALQRNKRREERARRIEESRTRKEAIVGEAEKISQGKDWRNGVNRLRDLLEEWKLLPRLDKKSDDELWHRFSGARTAYTRRRKAHFSELGEQREGARVVKERLLKEAESLSSSTEWGPTSTRYRELMQDWKAAGSAPRDVEEKLWQRFRTAQDAFFGAREAANAEEDREFAANAEKKRELLVEAEALLPVTDLEAAKRAFREISERWDDAGKVPRDDIKPLEARIRKVEQAIRSIEDDKWKRTDPEKSARAGDMLSQLERAIATLEDDLAKARAAGNEKKTKELEENLASRQQFLEMAQKAAADYS